MAFQVVRCEVAPEPLVPSSYDYADAFAVTLSDADPHTAEQWVRFGLEQSGAVVRRLIRFVHGRVLRFELDDGPGAILGWQVLVSEHDVLHMRTEGPLLRADIVARRAAPTTVGFATFLVYRSSLTSLLWRCVGPLHRRIAPYLLGRATTRLT